MTYFLQGVPAEGCPVLEDVIECVQGAQLPPLLLVINGWGCQSGLRGQWRGERGRGGGEILLLLLLLLRVCEIPGPSFFCSHHHLPSSSSSSFLLADLPTHTAQLLQATSPLPLPLTGWIRSASHPWAFTTSAASTTYSGSTTTFRTLHQHHDNHCHSDLSADC